VAQKLQNYYYYYYEVKTAECRVNIYKFRVPGYHIRILSDAQS